MSQSLQGFKSRLLIGGQRWRFKTLNYRVERPDLECPDSEGFNGLGVADAGTDGMASVQGRRKVKFTIERASFSLEDHPFEAPFDFSDPDARVEVSVIHDKSDETVLFNVPYAALTVAGCSIDVAGLQPCTIEGVADGNCTLPGET